jgi:hypothetical protein
VKWRAESAAWRDLQNDFSDDILPWHYEQSPHGK